MKPRAVPNPSIERTSAGKLRLPAVFASALREPDRSISSGGERAAYPFHRADVLQPASLASGRRSPQTLGVIQCPRPLHVLAMSYAI